MKDFIDEKNQIVRASNHFMPKGAWVAGGALNSVFTGASINDIDMYFKDKGSFSEAVKDAFADGMWCVSNTSRAVTFVQGPNVVQMMHFNWFETPQAIFDSFDFTCCMAAMDCETKDITMHDDFMRHCSQRFLKFHEGTAFPYGTMARVLKYQKRGYTIGVNELLRVALKCATVRINSWGDLKEQIGGQYGEAVMINDESDFSIDAAIAAMDGMEITAQKACEMPSNPHALLQMIFGDK